MGADLPELEIPVTTTLIIAGAIASRDFYPGHHDKDLAQRLGMRDVFMNILTTGGLIGRFLTDWAGSNAVLKNVAIRLGVPCYPGDLLKMTGRVIGRSDAEDGGIIDVDLRASHERGTHASATARIALPRGGDHDARVPRGSSDQASVDTPAPSGPADRVHGPGVPVGQSAEQTPLLAWLRSNIGEETEPPVTGRDPVNVPMIRAWCDAMGDRNPIYTDPELAGQSVHGGIVAPPTMIQAWFFPAVGTPRPPVGSRIGTIAAKMRESGFISLVATNCEQEYVRYARPGDVLTVRHRINDVSEEKQTALGAGHFLTTVGTVTDQHDEVICRICYRRLYFRPRVREA